jgi:hypothetical protein
VIHHVAGEELFEGRDIASRKRRQELPRDLFVLVGRDPPASSLRVLAGNRDRGGRLATRVIRST